MSPGEVICVGMATVDYVFELDEIPTRAVKVAAKSRVKRGGGPAATAAVACATLGTPASFWGRLGRDPEGDFLRGRLTAHGVAIDAVVDIESSTILAMVFIDRHGERMIVGHGVKALPQAIDALPFERIGAAGALLVDCSWPRAALAALEAARAHGVPSVLDAEESDPPNLEALARGASHPVFSEGAAQVLCGRTGSIREVVDGLCAILAGDFGVTLGARGSIWRIGGEIVEIPALPVASVDTTGAGDVFHGAVAAGLAERMPLIEAARFASACAGLKCAVGKGWDGMPSRAQVEEALRRL